MGCTASKIDNEDTVRRCKERRRFMKEAVQARHNLASAHSDYLRSLRFTGAALSDFAKGEPFSVSDQTPSVFLRNPSQIPQKSLPAPPPPPSSLPSPPPLKPLKKRPNYSHSSSPISATPKLPHILSESSLSSTPVLNHKKPPSYTNSHYSATPSQTSSVWNWENFYPPSPPDSEFFNRFNKEEEQNPDTHSQNHYHHLDDDDDEEEEEGTETEEVHCSEWGDHYSTSSSDTKSDNGDAEGDRESRSETGTRWNYGGSSIHDDTATSVSNYPPMGKSEKFDEAGSSVSWNAGNGEISDMRMVVRHQDLVEIVASIKEYFDKAATAGETVSDLLEISRAQIDRSIGQLKKTVYHSNSVLSSLSSSLTSKPPLSVKYRLDPSSLDEPGGSKSLCSTLERLWAWEKKLYEEVKAREGVKIEHEKKLSSLQSQEYKGDQAKLDKTKASIQRLQSLITVTSQAVSTTSSAITRVRDTELAPQLVELCHGLMYMWRSMNQLHEVQNDIVQQVRGLVNRATKGATTELHRQATCHLESAVSSWHSSFCRLIKYQRDYVHSLHCWLKLTLFHVGNENAIGIDTNEYHTHLDSVQISSGLVTFSDEWKQALDRLPDTVAAEAIKSFINVVHVISMKQSEELKMKKKTETASKELEKKSSSLRNLEKKFYQSYSMVGIGMPGGGSDGGGEVYDSRDPLSEKRLELKACQRRVEDEMSRHAISIEVTRAMTLNNIQTGLPGVFQAMTGFSSVFTEALEGVCTRSYSIK